MTRQPKLSRFTATLDGSSYVVLLSRPSSPSRFATNNYHDTWHIMSDGAGAAYLARVLWWLSYHRAENSVVVIDEPLLVPNPFDADPSSPIALFNADTTHLGRRATDGLRTVLRRKPRSEGTVRLSTAGLSRILDGGPVDALADRWDVAPQRFYLADRINGVVRLAARPDLLRAWAVLLADLGSWLRNGTTFCYLRPTEGFDRPEGEVQIFEWFDEMVGDARRARERLFPGLGHQELDDVRRQRIHESLPNDHIDRSKRRTATLDGVVRA
ncbi:MAG: hypothetical protein AAGA59_05020 [Actinomycetota bacterium]